MSEEEVERFEITDYDIDNEFNPQRNRRRPTKHQQIYGIWADDSEDENKNDSRNDRGSKKRKQKNYSAPIGFISAGIQNQKKDQPKEDISDDDESAITLDKKSKNYVANSSSDSDEDKPSFGRNNPANFQGFSETTGDIAGLRKVGRVPLNPALVKQGVGNWEKHTKGIGAKLLLQMGYKPGKGLGKDLQGISAPVEAQVRKGRGAIGAYGPEKNVTQADDKLKEEDSGKKFQQKQNKWKKDLGPAKKTRYYYRSVDDVIERGKQPGAQRTSDVVSNLSKVKVIDMTGPEQRVLSGYHALSGPRKPQGEGELFEDIIHKKCANFALPELQHNLDLLVDMCEQDIIWVDRKSRHCSDRTIALEQERKTLVDVVDKEKKQLNTLQSVLDVVERIMDPSGAFSLRQVADAFKYLKENYSEEYLMYDLGELAPGLVGPLLTSVLVSWSPLTAPNQYTDVFQQWKEILDQPHHRTTLAVNSATTQPFGSLVWTTWVPVIRAAVASWSPRECDPLIKLLSIWKPIIPNWILDNLLEQVILPQITSEVLEWNPLTDTIPIHIWIHPWIPLMGNLMQDTVYPIIEDKLGKALASWHPSDRSAKIMLRPWQAAMSAGAFAAFLHKYILHKLQACLSSLVINPHEQHLDVWKMVMEWSDMVSAHAMALLLEKCFLQRWLQTLAMWLNQQPNYTEVTEWFIGWKGMLSDQLLQQPPVKEYFRKALEMMNRAVKQPSGQQPGALESVSYLTNLETNIPPPPPPPNITPLHSESIAHAVRTATQISQSLSFKDVIAKSCEDRGILFVPIPNRYREAKQVYRIGSGSTQCYIDRDVIFSTTNGVNWTPTGLSSLLDMV